MGSIYSTYNGGLTLMTLHEFVILMTLPIRGTIISIGVQFNTIQYTSEYILKLQIHQHFLTIIMEITHFIENSFLFFNLTPTDVKLPMSIVGR